eukprot:CAMPEP_0202346052 /NCGR_PEP_ID=MMETSP1126-20121109/5011_1 /ASSEMBLY_ACC=CAM_ASM_000457 /TAXON_ID=3047 /ORGANISM="Dunaliella tertiolecta, Strain CCMP1320" /LENGTH=339 /DNA_ID=CAMNT_0048937411 /DNA_START=139 /DNA_END=1155 /DNA_ORIENTATION=-
MRLSALSSGAAVSQRAHGSVKTRMVAPKSLIASPNKIYSGLTLQRARVLTTTRAEPPTKEESKDPNVDSKVENLKEELKGMGMTKGKANEILRAWSSVGVRDASQLRKLLVQKSIAPIPSLSLQALFDATASFGGFYVANMAKGAEGFPFRIGAEIIGDFFGIYYFVQVLAEISVISALFYTSFKYGTSAVELLAAVQQMAGPKSPLSVAEKAAQAVNIFKVIQALEAVADVLREKYGDPPTDNSLRNLGAYLTLTQARDDLGFKPEDYGLNFREASNIAYAFAVYDVNQNFKLETSELGALCESLGKKLEGSEVDEALKMLDTDKNGYVDFKEFVSWW